MGRHLCWVKLRLNFRFVLQMAFNTLRKSVNIKFIKISYPNIKRTCNRVEGCTYFLGAIAKTFGDGILTTIKHFKCYCLKKIGPVCK